MTGRPKLLSIIPTHAALVEFGAGAPTKARLLLAACEFAAYVPVDISGDFLNAQARGLRKDFPHLQIYPVTADFTAPFILPDQVATMPKVGFFPAQPLATSSLTKPAAFCVGLAISWVKARTC